MKISQFLVHPNPHATPKMPFIECVTKNKCDGDMGRTPVYTHEQYRHISV